MRSSRSGRPRGTRSTQVLIANRGEIAVRVIRACRELASSPSRSTRMPTPTRRTCALPIARSAIGPAPPADSYLSIPAILDAARDTGADADPSGLRFSVRERGVRGGMREAGLIVRRPAGGGIERMGSKIGARALMAAGRRAGRARARRRPTSRDAAIARGGATGRLSGADQGVGRRRRQGHAARARRARARARRFERRGARRRRRSATARSTSSG